MVGPLLSDRQLDWWVPVLMISESRLWQGYKPQVHIPWPRPGIQWARSAEICVTYRIRILVQNAVVRLWKRSKTRYQIGGRLELQNSC